MSRRSWLLIGLALGVSAALGVAMLAAELGTTGIDPEAEFRASSRQIDARHQAVRGTRIASEADLATLKKTLAALLYERGEIAYPVTLSLPDRIARLAPHAVDPARCRGEALAHAVSLGRAISSARRRPCDESDASVAGRCILILLGSLSRAYDQYCRPR